MLFQEFTYKDYARVSREEGRAEGRMEGRAEGIFEERYAIARNALLMNMNINEISKLTKLTRKEIEGLRNLN